jgi:hypothetical protein
LTFSSTNYKKIKGESGGFRLAGMVEPMIGKNKWQQGGVRFSLGKRRDA